MNLCLTPVTTVDFTGSDRSWRWHVVSSYAARNGVFRFPLLPADVPDHNLASATSSQVVEATLFTVPGGYDGFRANAFGTDPATAIAGASGRLYYETPR